MARATRKIRLTRSIIVKGEHRDKGTVLEAPNALCAHLVGDGSAEYHEDSAKEVAAEEAKGVTVRDPHTQQAEADIKVVSVPEKKSAPKIGPAGEKSKSA